MSGRSQPTGTWLAGLVSLALLVAGALAFDHALDLRAHREPPQLVVGSANELFRDLPDGVEAAAEIRATALTAPSPALRSVGARWRHAGLGLFAAATAAALLGSASACRQRSLGGWCVRLVWAGPALFGVAELVRSAGAGAPSVAMARQCFEGALPLIALGVVLLLAWRR